MISTWILLIVFVVLVLVVFAVTSRGSTSRMTLMHTAETIVTEVSGGSRLDDLKTTGALLAYYTWTDSLRRRDLTVFVAPHTTHKLTMTYSARADGNHEVIRGVRIQPVFLNGSSVPGVCQPVDIISDATDATPIEYVFDTPLQAGQTFAIKFFVHPSTVEPSNYILLMPAFYAHDKV